LFQNDCRNNAAIEYINKTINELQNILKQFNTMKFLRQLTIVNFNFNFHQCNQELLLQIIEYIRQHCKYLHKLTIDCQDSFIPVQIWNECSLIPTLTSFSILNLETEDGVMKYDVDYWSDMNICPTLTRIDCIPPPSSIQAPNLTSLTTRPYSAGSKVLFDEINSFTNLQYLNVTYLSLNADDHFHLFLLNLPTKLLSLIGLSELEDEHIQIILQRCPALTELDLNGYCWERDVEQDTKINNVLLNNQTLKILI
jgi:hypothetical protein